MFAFIGGDLGYDNGKSVEISLAFLRNYSKHMVGRDGRLIPMMTCIGNHEVVGGFGKTRAKRHRSSMPCSTASIPKRGYASLDFGDYLSLVLLDTGHTTPIGGEQAEWLEKTLKARVDHPNVFVANHVPRYPSFRNPAAGAGGQGGDRRSQPQTLGAALREISRPCRAGTSRSHLQADQTPDRRHGERQRRALSRRRLLGPAANPNTPDKLSYLAASSRDYHMSLHRIQGEKRFHLALDEFGRVMDVASTGQRKKGPGPRRRRQLIACPESSIPPYSAEYGGEGASRKASPVPCPD